MNIEVGEYIRTKKKGIFKVLSIRKTPYGYYCGTVDNDNIRTFTIGKGGNAEIKKDIVKHSKNIIDLIEVGDFVNGNKVHSVDYSTSTQTGEKYLVIDKIYISVKFFYERDIKSIVTKEQFSNMEYRL